MSKGETGCVLVYRDRIGVRSEVQFLRRLYVGFDRLSPVWLGCHIDGDAAALGAPVMTLGGPGLLGAIDRAAFKQLARVPSRPALAELKPRLIHAHFGRGGALALPLARALGVPLAVTFHGGDATKDTHYRRRLFPTIYQRRLTALQREAALFHCVSDFIRDALVDRGFPPGKMRVINYGIETDLGAPPAAPPRPPYLLFVGRLVAKKGVSDLIAAMRLLRDRGIAEELVVIGDGPLAAMLKALARSVTGVRFLGWQAPEDVRGWMAGALALCVPSVRAEGGDAEGLPNVVLEAMALGVPVIGSRHAGIGEAIEDGESGFLVPPGDPAALANAIEQVLTDAEARRRNGARARRVIAERFDAKVQSHRLEDALLSVAGSRRDTPA